MKKTSILVIFTSLSYAVTVSASLLANIFRLNGYLTSEIPYNFPNLFIPASFVYGIRIVMYCLLFGFQIICIRTVAQNKTDIGYTSAQTIDAISPLLIVAYLANALLIYLWHGNFVFASLLVMLVILASIATVYKKLGIGRYKGWEMHSALRVFVHTPISIYLAWISTAVMLTLSMFLVSVRWNGFGIPEEIWVSVLIVFASVLASFFVFKFKDYAFGIIILLLIIAVWLQQAMVF